jgi:hypothetical protein
VASDPKTQSLVKKRRDNDEGENDSQAHIKQEAKPKHRRMSNTTVFVLCVAVPLLLGGFANFYAHKPWILYLPLFGLLLALGYGGHLAIQSNDRKSAGEREAVAAEERHREAERLSETRHAEIRSLFSLFRRFRPITSSTRQSRIPVNDGQFVRVHVF